MAEFVYEDLLPLADDPTDYRLLTTEGVAWSTGRAGGSSSRSTPRRCGC